MSEVQIHKGWGKGKFHRRLKNDGEQNGLWRLNMNVQGAQGGSKLERAKRARKPQICRMTSYRVVYGTKNFVSYRDHLRTTQVKTIFVKSHKISVKLPPNLPQVNSYKSTVRHEKLCNHESRPFPWPSYLT